jgi:uncharacterized delta-60 repeat protein
MLRAPRFSQISLAVALLAIIPAAAPRTAAATVEAAPGRIAFPVAGGRARLTAAVPLPGGGALLAGVVERSGWVYLAKISGTGELEQSFGAGGVAAIDAELSFEQVLIQPDGKILLVGMHSTLGHLVALGWHERHGPLVVVRLNPDGSIDRGYGEDGTAQSTLEGGCYCHTIALEQEDGGLVVTGQRELTVHEHGEARETYSWALARLTAAGGLDPSFGQGGVATVPGEDGVGLSIAPSQDGTIVAQGQTTVTAKDGSYGPENLMTRLTADGAPDTSYAGGTPFQLPVFALDDSYGQVPEPLEALAEPDGRVVIETIVPTNPSRHRRSLGIGLTAYDAAGDPDRTFGYAGYLDLEEGPEASGSELIPLPGEEILAVHRRGSSRRTENAQSVPGIVEFERVTPAGLLDGSFAKPPGTAVDVPFGGGLAEPASPSPFSYPEADFSLTQNSFLGPKTSPLVVPQPDGSLLLAGTVSLSAPAARGVPERTIDRFALAVLTPSLSLDTAAGGPAHAPALTVQAPRQSAREDTSHRRILLAAQTSAPGLVRVELFSGQRLLASRLGALLDTAETRIAVPLSPSGARYLRAHPRARIRATVALRDLLADHATRTTSFRLR